MHEVCPCLGISHLHLTSSISSSLALPDFVHPVPTRCQSRFQNVVVTALEPTALLVVSKEDGLVIFGSEDFQFQQLASNVSFLQSLPLFSAWSRSRLTRLLSVMVHRIDAAGELIVRQVCFLLSHSRP